MASIGDLVHQTSTTTGTSDLTLSAVNGKRSFNTAFGTGGSNLFYYFVANQGAGEWEVGTGHLSSSTVLVRDTVISSSNANAAVNFSAGTKDVTNDVIASKQAQLDVANVFTAAQQFTTVELGHASDTTLSRTGAGAIAVEGVGVALNSTSLAHTCSQIELGHASDTTLSRSAAGVMAVEGIPVYPSIPQNSQSVDYTLVLADAQKHIYQTGASKTLTIPANSSVAFPIGTAITFVSASNAVTIAITSDTLTLAGAGTTGSRTLAANSMATALKLTSTTWIISGQGLT